MQEREERAPIALPLVQRREERDKDKEGRRKERKARGVAPAFSWRNKRRGMFEEEDGRDGGETSGTKQRVAGGQPANQHRPTALSLHLQAHERGCTLLSGGGSIGPFSPMNSLEDQSPWLIPGELRGWSAAQQSLNHQWREGGSRSALGAPLSVRASLSTFPFAWHLSPAMLPQLAAPSMPTFLLYRTLCRFWYKRGEPGEELYRSVRCRTGTRDSCCFPIFHETFNY